MGGFQTVYRYLIFDLDGTLIDSLPGITRSANYALETCGFPKYPDGQSLSWFVGPPLRENFKKLLNTDDLLLIEKLVATYRAIYRDIAVDAKLYPGIAELLIDLAGKKTLAIATSKLATSAKMILKHYELDHFFAMIVGSEPNGALSSKEESIKHIIDVSGGSASNYLFIGDRGADVIGARKNSVDCVGVLYGYGAVQEIEEARPKFVAKSVTDLRTLLLSNPGT